MKKLIDRAMRRLGYISVDTYRNALKAINVDVAGPAEAKKAENEVLQEGIDRQKAEIARLQREVARDEAAHKTVAEALAVLS